jgi:hypothetical protein
MHVERLNMSLGGNRNPVDEHAGMSNQLSIDRISSLFPEPEIAGIPIQFYRVLEPFESHRTPRMKKQRRAFLRVICCYEAAEWWIQIMNFLIGIADCVRKLNLPVL